MVRAATDREKLDVLSDIYARINSSYTDVTGLLTEIIESATALTEGEAINGRARDDEDASEAA